MPELSDHMPFDEGEKSATDDEKSFVYGDKMAAEANVFAQHPTARRKNSVILCMKRYLSDNNPLNFTNLVIH